MPHRINYTELFDQYAGEEDEEDEEEVEVVDIEEEDDEADGGDAYAAFQRNVRAKVSDWRKQVQGGSMGEFPGDQEDDDELGSAQVEYEFSPTKKQPQRNNTGQRRQDRKRPHQPKFTRHDKGFELIQAGITSEPELDKVVADYGDRYCAGRGVTPSGSWRGKFPLVKLWRCLYHRCPFELRAERSEEGPVCSIVLKASYGVGYSHNAHRERDEPTISVPGEIRALLQPHHLAMPPKKLRACLRKVTLPDGFKVETLLDSRNDPRSARLRAGLERLHKRHLEQKRRSMMTEGAGDSFGGLSSILQKLERSYLESSGIFSEHSVFLLGEPLVVPETGRVTFAVSTENLLLNAYRQSCFGLPPLLAVDTTHRLMTASQYCCMLIGTSSATQHFHIIAYGICSHEDSEAHAYVFRQVFAAVDQVVADRARTGTRV